MPDPAGGSDSELLTFYKRRGLARAALGQVLRSLEDLRNAYPLMEKSQIWDREIEKELALAEMQVGNLKRAIELFERHIKKPDASGIAYTQLVKLYGRMGDFEAAKKARDRGVAIAGKRYRRALHWRKVHMAEPSFFYLTAQGKHTEAEPFARRALEGRLAGGSRTLRGIPMSRLHLAMNLMHQGRLVEAEIGARQAIKEALALGRDANMTGYTLWGLGKVLMAQGRVQEAEKIYSASVALMERLHYPQDSLALAWGKIHVGDTLAAQKRYSEALARFQSVRDGLVANRFLYDTQFSRKPSVIFTHIMAGRTDEAEAMIRRAEPVIERGLGPKSCRSLELRAFRAMVRARQGRLDEAVKDFSAAVPLLLERRAAAESHGARLRLSRIIESYMDILRRVRDSSSVSRYEFDIDEAMFQLAEAMNGSKVQQALGASGARAAIGDPDLADLVRREQDAAEQIKTLQETLTSLLAIPADQQDAAARDELKRGITALEKALDSLSEEIQSRFPKYADFIDPKPLGFRALQGLLHPKEALVVMATTQDRTYVWAVPFQGRVAFASPAIGREAMNGRIAHLRKALDPGPRSLGDIPAFDLAEAHDIYRQVLAPVAAGWRDAEHLVVVTAGPLGQIPLALLPTAPVPPDRKETVLFENYRTVPWMIRKVDIARVPSAAAFALQRRVGPGRPDRHPFAGFGDPVYNSAQLSESGTISQNLASRGLNVRGVRVTAKGALDSTEVISSQIERLNRLPDTAEEIQSIARAMDADPAADVFLGARASEGTVKSMNLADRRVIAFASHALVPGDLDGLDQPALALSAPSVTGQADDGLLTMGEVMQLHLDADWVVLSACNTGAAGGAGEEAVSGLGRAFFYAGARALLVSMWPVETTSAKKLTTGLFEIQKKNPAMSRAAAARQSMLKLMDGPGIQDEASGKTAASYAHPLFWAPFIIVGESG